MAIELGAAGAAAAQSDSVLQRSFKMPGANKVTSRDRKFFTEQLALMLETGSSLIVALDLMAEQSASPALTETLEGVASGVREGATLAAALAAFPQAFPATYVTLIRAAEDGGYLERALRHLLAMEENSENCTPLWCLRLLTRPS